MIFQTKTPVNTDTTSPAKLDNPPMLNEKLGLLSGLKVNMAANRAKANAQVQVAEAVAAAAADMALTAIQYQQTEIKTGMANGHTIRQGALAMELVARVTAVQEQLNDMQAEGFGRLAVQRQAHVRAIQQQLQEGILSEAEALEAIEFIRSAIAREADRLVKNVERVKNSIDSMSARATDHLPNHEGN